MEDGPLLRSICQNAGKARGLGHDLIFRSKGIDLEKIHAESVTVACDSRAFNILAINAFVWAFVDCFLCASHHMNGT